MKIAIIGTGISGLGAASLFAPHHDITIYEKEGRPGGHSRTVEVQLADKKVAVDTGFIVFNHQNYPLLSALFSHLGVELAKSNMSFGVSIDDGWLEYGTEGIAGIFAQKRNLIRPAFLKMLLDITRFNRRSKLFLDRGNPMPMETYLRQLGLGDWVWKYYVLAMAGAIWSVPMPKMRSFPARQVILFFDNHGLLKLTNKPQWYTVKGGSRAYVEALIPPFKDSLKLGCGVRKVIRQEETVRLIDETGQSENYDEVIFACHSNQALELIDAPSAEEKSVLGRIPYQPNRVFLHSDTRFMPKNKTAWASWVYLSQSRAGETPQISLSYWMNNLQPLDTDTPFIVTLNPPFDPHPTLTHDCFTFDHPVFDHDAIEAQQNLSLIQGRDKLWFCGAWQGYGFHEDGLKSAVTLAERWGIKAPWVKQGKDAEA